MALLGIADYVVMSLMMAVSVAIGVFFAVRGKDTREGYLLGNRQMGVVSVSISMFVTLQSAVSLLGFPAEIYTYGTMILYIFISYTLTYITAVFTFLPLLYPLHITSIYEYLGRRYDSAAVRRLGTTIGMLQTILYMAVALLSPALALQASAGIPLWTSIIIAGLVATLYTCIGGIKSVVWTDVFQSIFMLGGSVLVIVVGVVNVGGFGNVIDINRIEGRMETELSVDPRVRHTMWGILIGGFFNWYVNLFSQSTIQRLFAINTMKRASIAFLLNIPMILLYGVLLAFSGLLLVAYYFTVKCDPYEANRITNRNQMMPHLVIDLFGRFRGLSGLYMSALFSGALSTLSSGINALATNTVEDVLSVPLKKASEKTVTIVAKVSVCFYGCLAIGLAYLVRATQGPMIQMSMTAMGTTGGPIVGIFFLGGAFPFANKVGALVGGVTALTVNVLLSVFNQLYGVSATPLHPAPVSNCTGEGHWVTPLNNITTPYTPNITTYEVNESDVNYRALSGRPFHLYDISYIWYSFIGFVVVLVVGGITSLITGGRYPGTRDPMLLFPFSRKLWNYRNSSIIDLQTIGEDDERESGDHFKQIAT